MNYKETQQQKVLRLLKEAGIIGVNSYTFTYGERIKQIATRVFELKEQGYNISSKMLPNRSVQYILIDGSLSLVSKKQIPPIPEPKQPWDESSDEIPVKKMVMFNGKLTERICWEKPENINPKQEAISL